MSISIIYLLVAFLDFSKSKWTPTYQLLNSNQKFTQATGIFACCYSGSFVLPSLSTTANFITCTTPPISYITLNNTYPSTKSYYTYNLTDGDYVTFDLFFQGITNYISIIHTWSSENVQFTIGSFTYSYTYTSPSTYPTTNGFCDDLPFQIRSVNFTISLPSFVNNQIYFTSSNTNSGQVSIRNVIVSRIQCYPSCKQCTGPKFDECTSCYYGLPTNNICPPCPSNQYYMKNIGCKDICNIYSQLYYNGFCQQFTSYLLESASFSSTIPSPSNFASFQQYDPQHIDLSPGIKFTYSKYTYGIFKFNSGFYRFFKYIYNSLHQSYQIGLLIEVFTFSNIPINCGIQFMIMEIFNYNLQLYNKQQQLY